MIPLLLNSLPVFSYSDFQVNEIDLDGQVVHLTTLEERTPKETGENAELVLDDVDVTGDVYSVKTLLNLNFDC